jgi:hypothetical protein
MGLPLAHTAGGHWVIDLMIYLGPFFSIIAVVMFTDRRRKRMERQEAAEGAPSEGAAAPDS